MLPVPFFRSNGVSIATEVESAFIYFFPLLPISNPTQTYIALYNFIFYTEIITHIMDICSYTYMHINIPFIYSYVAYVFVSFHLLTYIGDKNIIYWKNITLESHDCYIVYTLICKHIKYSNRTLKMMLQSYTLGRVLLASTKFSNFGLACI